MIFRIKNIKSIYLSVPYRVVKRRRRLGLRESFPRVVTLTLYKDSRRPMGKRPRPRVLPPLILEIKSFVRLVELVKARSEEDSDDVIFPSIDTVCSSEGSLRSCYHKTTDGKVTDCSKVTKVNRIIES